MRLTRRDRRALMALGVVAAALLASELVLTRRESAASAPSGDSVPAAARRLARVRQTAGSLPAAEADLAAASQALAGREKGVLQADTLPQAQAQLLQIARRVSSLQAPPIEIRAVEVGRARPLTPDYAEISVPLTFQCRIEQLVNFLADLTSQPELLATSELRLGEANPKEKFINVRLTLTAVVPARLAPDKKGREGL
ncbi:MAG: hypothetical protein IT159_15605 [Bryobacterales bacterium]|nr:hypothetical protein [Bryobacterales bacterium]